MRAPFGTAVAKCYAVVWCRRVRVVSLLLLLVHAGAAWASFRSSGHSSRTYCGATLAHADRTGPWIATSDPSRSLRERLREEETLDILRERYFPRTELQIVGRGFENLIVLVSSTHEPAFVVRVPRRFEWRRVAEAYRRELRFLARAKARDAAGSLHLAIPRRFVVDEPSGLPILFLDYVPDGSLDRHLHAWGSLRAQQNPEAVLGLWRQMALAVRALHRVGVVHRDVKPGNFLVGVRGELLLTDLGLATTVGRQVSGLEGLLSGTLSHMSVNQLGRGNAAFSDDLYALKITFRETLVGATVWQVDAQDPENHVLLQPIDEFGTYPILYALPRSVAERVPARLRAVTESDFDSIDALLAALRF